MSERVEKRRRRNQRLAYIAAYNRWLEDKPSIWQFWRWRRWRKAEPVYRDKEG